MRQFYPSTGSSVCSKCLAGFDWLTNLPIQGKLGTKDCSLKSNEQGKLLGCELDYRRLFKVGVAVGGSSWLLAGKAWRRVCCI